MPWHFGGPQELTYAEVLSYFDYLKRKRKAEKDAAGKQQKPAGRARRQ